MPERTEIVNYWRERQRHTEAAINFVNYGKRARCFACGCLPGNGTITWEEATCFDKAHIIAGRLGGTKAPSNLLILCRNCHHVMPQTLNYVACIEWCIRRRHRHKSGRKSVLFSCVYDAGLDINKFNAWSKYIPLACCELERIGYDHPGSGCLSSLFVLVKVFKDLDESL